MNDQSDNLVECYNCKDVFNRLDTVVVKNHRFCNDCAADYAEYQRECIIEKKLLQEGYSL